MAVGAAGPRVEIKDHKLAESPGPMRVPAEQLRGMLRVRQVSYVQGQGRLAVVESPLV